MGTENMGGGGAGGANDLHHVTTSFSNQTSLETPIPGPSALRG